MDQYGEKAIRLVEEAKKKLASSSFWTFSNKYEEAAEIFKNAANNFKLGRKWKEAGEAHVEAASSFLKAKLNIDAADQYREAAKYFEKISSEDAIKALVAATDLLVEQGRMSIVAKTYEKLGNLYQQENQIENALQAYQLASDFYQLDDSEVHSIDCLNNIAEIASELEQYDKSIQMYTQIVEVCLKDSLLKWNLPKYLFRMILCCLAQQDSIKAKRVLDEHIDSIPSFAITREAKFLQKVIETMENYDLQGFLKEVKEYDDIKRLDPWTTRILLKIKSLIEGTEDSLA